MNLKELLNWKGEEGDRLRELIRAILLFKRNAAFWSASRRAKIILIAGMQRSGSTWMFNAVRLLLQHSVGNGIGSGWVEDIDTFKNDKTTLLVKLHRYEPVVVRCATLTLYSFRDIRDSLASLKRLTGKEPTIESARNLINRDLKWKTVADFVMRYEDMKQNPVTILHGLAHVLNVKDYDEDKILSRLNNMGYNSTSAHSEVHEHNLDNLMHKGHITDGRHGSWHGWISGDCLQRIQQEFAGWLLENDYPLIEGEL